MHMHGNMVVWGIRTRVVSAWLMLLNQLSYVPLPDWCSVDQMMLVYTLALILLVYTIAQMLTPFPVL
jgi:hypothetical protein